MDIILLIAVFILIIGIAMFYCNLLKLNIAEGMMPAVLTVILFDAVAVGLAGSYIIAIGGAVLLAAIGAGFAVFRQIKEKNGFRMLLSPCIIALAAVFFVSIMIYRGDVIQNIEELGLWAMADKYMAVHDKLYSYQGITYLQGASLFHYIFLRTAGFSEGTLYAVSALLYWIGLLLPFGRLPKEKSPRLLLYILLVHSGLYSLYYFGSKTCGPELPLACWTGGLAGWWITRDKEKKSSNAVVLISGLVGAFTFTSSVDMTLVILVLLLAATEKAGSRVLGEKHHDREQKINFGMLYLLAGALVWAAGTYLYGTITRFTYLIDNMTSFLRCLVENNMSLGRSDFNHTFIFNIVLIAVLYFAVADRDDQRKAAARYMIYSIAASAIYLTVLIYGLVDAKVHPEEDYMIQIQRLIAMCAIYLLVMALSWMLCEERMLERKASYIPGLILLVAFLYGVNANYLTYTTAAYPEKRSSYAQIQKVKRECGYIKDLVPKKYKIYMINQGDEIASAEARFLLEDQISDSFSQAWKYSISGGMVHDQDAPYDTLEKLPEALTEGKYRYVWIFKTNKYLTSSLPEVMGDAMVEEMLDDEIIKQRIEKVESMLISSDTITGGQLCKVLYSDKKALALQPVKNVVPYDTRKTYYRWNNIIE